MNLIVDLPSVLQASILCSWLDDSVEIGLLDSAFCNRKLRPEFLETLSACYVIPTISTNEADVLTWLMCRNVKANDLTVLSDVSNDTRFIEKFFNGIGSNATSLTFAKDEDSGEYNYDYHNTNPELFIIPGCLWPVLPKYCSKLRRINCVNAQVDTAGLSAVIAAATQLREINLEGAQNVGVDVLKACCAAPHLEKLNIERVRIKLTPEPVRISLPVSNSLRTFLAADFSLPPAAAIPLLVSFPGLLELSMTVRESADVERVAKYTPNLQKCTSSGLKEPVSAATATAVCVHWRHVQYLAMYSFHRVACSEDALVVLIQELPNIRYLRLMRSTLKRDLPVHSLQPTRAEGGSNSSLQDLQTGFMSVATMQRIVSVCPALHTVHLSCPPSRIEPHARGLLDLLHDTAVSTLVLENCIVNDADLLCIRNIEHLYFVAARHGHFSETALQNMARQNSTLQTFQLSGSAHHANYTNLRVVLKSCPQLGTLVVTSDESNKDDCTHIHHAFYNMIKEFYPNIHTVQIML